MATEQTAESFAGADGFDFWVGEWNADVGGGATGVSVVTREYARRVIRERFTTAQLNGESVSIFNPARQVWCQTWIDDNGAYLLFVGRREPDRMILEGRRPDGAPNGTRMVWDRISADAFEWDYQKRDADAWTSQWHISYVRRGSVTPSAGLSAVK